MGEIHLSDAEWEIMNCLWNKPNQKISEIVIALSEKKVWDKDSGRMYAHNIISWHKDEQITPEQALEFGKQFAETWFSGFQTLVAVHKDKDHIHCHLVTNSVSYEDGRKLHNTKKDLERMPAGFREEIKSLAQKKGGVLEISGETRNIDGGFILIYGCLLYTSPSPRDRG